MIYVKRILPIFGTIRLNLRQFQDIPHTHLRFSVFLDYGICIVRESPLRGNALRSWTIGGSSR